jgi:hypothetical protein
VVVEKEKNDNGRKNQGEADFFPTLASDFFLFNARNSPLFIEGGRWTFCFYWRQILALDLNKKDPNS